MQDPFTLDQLRALLAVVDAGSFSAAGRKLHRVQSAVSQAMGTLEERLGVVIWDRSRRVAVLTEQGRAVLGAARRVCHEADAMRDLTAGLLRGVEAAVSLCIDAVYPLDALAEVCQLFAREFPAVDLRVDTQTRDAVAARVLDGSATLGVVGPAGLARGLAHKLLAPVRMLPVIAAQHPLARHRGAIPAARMNDVVQILLGERAAAGAPDQHSVSTRTWRVADLHAQHALVVAGLGWATLPEHLVRDDLRRKRLVRLKLAAGVSDEYVVHLAAVYRSEAALGPAHRWLLARLERSCAQVTVPARAGGTRG